MSRTRTESQTVMPGRLRGLSVRLITTIITVILAFELLIYLPSIANYRAAWLDDRLRVGVVAVRVLDAVPDVLALPRTLTDRLLIAAEADAIAYRRSGQSQLIERADRTMPDEVAVADMRERDPFALMAGAIDTLVSGGGRTLRIVGPSDTGEGVVELLMPERALHAEMLVYSRNALVLSAIVAAITALVLYVFVSRLLLRPIRRITGNMLAYRQAPESPALILAPSGRKDEIGILERELSAMQSEIFTLLRQRRHLADLGLAVAKINHDLRNTLTSAQLLSDQVATLDDPGVQRLAPRLVTTLDRAIGFAQSVLDYGRQNVTPPKPEPVSLADLAADAAFDAGLVGHPAIAYEPSISPDLVVFVDPAQMTRVLSNLLKNAREALEAIRTGTAEPARVTLGAERDETGGLVIAIADNGPGLPPRARENLFVAFEGSARAGGTGLGLAIARELTEAHDGQLHYVADAPGTRFEIRLPPRVLALG